jgi:hypothetical protein
MLLMKNLVLGATGFYSNLERSAGIRLQLQAHDTIQTRTGVYIEKRSYSYKSQSILGKKASWVNLASAIKEIK